MEPKHRNRAAIVALKTAEDGQDIPDGVEAAFARFDPETKKSLDAVVTAAGGRVIERGERCVVLAFSDVAAAMSSITDLRLRLLKAARRREREDLAAALRIGIDFGDVLIGEDDLLSYRANIASRLADQAAPDELILSKAAFAEASESRELTARSRRMLSIDGVEPIEMHVVAFEEEKAEGPDIAPAARAPSPPPRRGLLRPALVTLFLLAIGMAATSVALEIPYDRAKLTSLAVDITDRIPGGDTLRAWGEKFDFMERSTLAPADEADPLQRSRYRLATAPVGSSLADNGEVLAERIQTSISKRSTIELEAVASESQQDSLKRLRAGDVHFAILEGLAAHFTYSGTGPGRLVGSDPDLRAIATLSPRAEQFLLRKEFVDTGTIDDLLALRDQKISLGVLNSSGMHSSRSLLDRLGADITEDLDVVFSRTLEKAVEALVNGDIAAISLPGLVPSELTASLFEELGDDVTILQFEERHLTKANERLGLWTGFVIPANTYDGQTEAVQTIAQAHFLATRAEMAETLVYDMSKALLEEMTFLDGLNSTVRRFRLEVALMGIPVPLHPGALRYYEEAVDVDVPSYLMPPDAMPTQ